MTFSDISPDFQKARSLAELFERRGRRIYLVGGAVRDYVLRHGKVSAASSRGGPQDSLDLDLTTDALPDEVEEIASGWADSLWLAGKRFGTVALTKGGTKFEITTHRAEAYSDESRKPVVRFSDSIEEDLSRRDFTINSMAFELSSTNEPVLIDPFSGLSDLVAGVLRTPLSAEVSFFDDPLRMLRAARFVSRFQLVPTEELVAAMAALKNRLQIVSKERVRDEFDKLMVCESPQAGLWLLVDTGVMDEFIPEISALKLEQDPIHRHKDVLAHTIAVVEKASPEKILRLAALFHDIGKPATRQIGKDGVSFHFHDVVGAKLTKARLRMLKYPEKEIEVISKLVYLHLRFHTYGAGWTDKAVRRYVSDAGDLLDRLNELTVCDCTTRNENKARQLKRQMDVLIDRIAKLREQEELDSIRPDLDGLAVMELLEIPPGQQVGRALEYLMDLRMEEGPLGKEEATRRLLAWWKEKQPKN